MSCPKTPSSMVAANMAVLKTRSQCSERSCMKLATLVQRHGICNLDAEIGIALLSVFYHKDFASLAPTEHTIKKK